MTNVALIAAACPGLGDPMQLAIDDYGSILARVPFVMKFKLGALDQRDLVEYESGLLGVSDG